MNFHTITSEDQVKATADAIVSRERDVHSYDVNIANYTKMLEDLPAGEWPADLVAHKDTPPPSLVDKLTTEQVETVARYQYRDQLRRLLITERIEREKSARVLDALLMQLPEDKTKILADAKLRIG